MSRRGLFTALAIVVVALLAWLWLGQPSRERNAASPPSDTTVHEPRPGRSGVSSDEAGRRAIDPIFATGSQQATGFDLSGQFVDAESGSQTGLEFEGVLHARVQSLSPPLETGHVDAHVRDGRWTVHLERPARLLLDGAAARDGRGLELVTTELLARSAAEVTVAARWRTGVHVRLFDAGTGEELAEGTAAWSSSPTSSVLPSSGPPLGLTDGFARTSSPTPLRLPAWLGVKSIHVTSPGYEWRRLAVSGDSGTRRVDLHPSGSLRCVVSPDASFPEGSRIRVFHAAEPSDLLVEGSVPRDEVVFDGLRIGEVDVFVEAAAASAARPRYWGARASIRANRETVIRLDSNSTGDDQLFGRLLVRLSATRAMLSRNDLALRIVRTDDASSSNPSWEHGISEFRIMESGTEAAFERSDLVPGRYLLEIAPLAAAEAVTLEARSTATFELRVDELADVVVRANLPAGRTPMPSDSIRLHSPLIDSAFVGASAKYDPRGDMFRVSVAPGTYILRCAIAGFDAPRETVEVHPGDNALEVVCEPAPPGVRVVLEARHSDAEHPLPFERWITIQVLDGQGVDQGFRTIGFGGPAIGECCETSRVEILLASPGTYRLEIPDVKGRPRVDPVTVSVDRDSRVTATVQVRP
jgi:hypothetical protein